MIGKRWGPRDLAAYLTLLLLIALVFWLRERSVQRLAACLVSLLAGLLVPVWPLYLQLEKSPLASGLPCLAAGSLAMLGAFVISLLKMGAAPRGRQWFARLNPALANTVP